MDYVALPGKNGSDARKLISLSADYLFDVTHFMGGYNPDRKFGVELFAGPVLSFGKEPNKTNIGAEGGVHFIINCLRDSVFLPNLVCDYTLKIYGRVEI